MDSLREVTPTAHMGVPRVWEKIMEKIKEGISRCGYMKRKMVTWAMSVSLDANQRKYVHCFIKKFVCYILDIWTLIVILFHLSLNQG